MRRWRVRRGGACACGGLRAFAPRAQVTSTLTPCLRPLSDCLLSSAGGVPGHVGLQAAIWPGVDTHTSSDSWGGRGTAVVDQQQVVEIQGG